MTDGPTSDQPRRTEFVTVAQTPRGPLPFFVREGIAATAISAVEYHARIAQGIERRTSETLLDMAGLAPHVFIPIGQSSRREGLRHGYYTNGVLR